MLGIDVPAPCNWAVLCRGRQADGGACACSLLPIGVSFQLLPDAVIVWARTLQIRAS